MFPAPAKRRSHLLVDHPAAVARRPQRSPKSARRKGGSSQTGGGPKPPVFPRPAMIKAEQKPVAGSDYDRSAPPALLCSARPAARGRGRPAASAYGRPRLHRAGDKRKPRGRRPRPLRPDRTTRKRQAHILTRKISLKEGLINASNSVTFSSCRRWRGIASTRISEWRTIRTSHKGGM